VGIVPLILSRRKIGPVIVLSASFLGADPAFTEIRGAIVRPGFEAAVAATTHASLDTVRDWDWIHWNGVSGNFWTAVQHDAVLRSISATPFYLLDLPSSWEEFRKGLKRNIRESIRHCYNSLKRDGHAFSFNVVTTPQAVRAALPIFFDLHRMRSSVRNTMIHPDRFETASSQAFLHTVCEGFARQDMLRIFQLRIADQVVAMRIGFQVGDSLYLYYSGFDPVWSHYSVMTTAVVESIKYAIAQGLKTVNLSPGADVSKTRWGGREVHSESAFQHGHRLRSRMVRSAWQHAANGQGLSAQLLKRLISVRRRWD
jgi:CelD/BcsL family acetyltransferase involved in cellulose biosynthesis